MHAYRSLGLQSPKLHPLWNRTFIVGAFAMQKLPPAFCHDVRLVVLRSLATTHSTMVGIAFGMSLGMETYRCKLDNIKTGDDGAKLGRGPLCCTFKPSLLGDMRCSVSTWNPRCKSSYIFSYALCYLHPWLKPWYCSSGRMCLGWVI